MLPLWRRVDTVQHYSDRFNGALQRFGVWAWYELRRPRTTAILAGLMALALLLRFLLPQQATPDETATAWLVELPLWLRPWGEPLFFLGFSRIFQSLWFWLPLALLLLSSLVALADYGPAARRRAGQGGELERQHPLAGRTEQSVRLPPNPNAYLDKLKETLQAEQFVLESPVDEHQRLVKASRRRWAWWAVPGSYGGLLLLGLAFITGFFSLKSERLSLPPLQAQPSKLFNGTFELSQLDSNWSPASLIYRPQGAQTEQPLTWRLYLPTLFQNAVVLPVAAQPVLTVEARDAQGQPRRLIPVQVELSPATRLNLPADDPAEPFLIFIPSASLSFQIAPIPDIPPDNYNIQVLRTGESEPSENFTAQLGETFEIDDLTITIDANYSLELIARRDPALPLYGLSLALIGLSLLVLRLWPPWHIWLIPEVKGRGGQLYGVVETIGRPEAAAQFLERLLAVETGPEKESDLEI